MFSVIKFQVDFDPEVKPLSAAKMEKWLLSSYLLSQHMLQCWLWQMNPHTPILIQQQRK